MTKFLNLRTLSHTLRAGLITSFLACGMIFTPTTAFAQRVEPMSYNMAPSGAAATRALRIENTTQNAITIELTANKISVDDYGKETKTPAEDDFLIFPPQAIVKPGKTQTVRVKYIGDPKIEKSSNYRISVSQLPIDLGNKTGGAVGFVINFHTLATIAPEGSEADLHVTSIQPGSNGQWDMTIENRGNRMGRLSRSSWKVSDTSGKDKTLSERDVSKLTDKNLVMPGRSLKLSVPALEGFNSRTTSVEISVRS